MIYLIGSLRNPKVPEVAERIRSKGFEVFDDWYAAGPEADDYWKKYELARNHDYKTGLQGYPARHVFDFDYYHLDRADQVILMCPAGKSGHLELGWSLGRGKPGYILLDPEDVRWDVMYQFANGVFDNLDDLIYTIETKHGGIS